MNTGTTNQTPLDETKDHQLRSLLSHIRSGQETRPFPALVSGCSFVRVGEQLDPVDGVEFVYEVAARTGRLR